MKQQQGFSLIEVVIAILILTAGLIALAGALISGVTLPQRARQQEIAKQLANEIMESIIFAKEAAPPGFDSFDSLAYTDDGGRFVRNATNPNISKMLEAGPDNVFGTCDDGQNPGTVQPCGAALGNVMREYSIDPGADGRYSTTTNNRRLQLLNYSREIIIRDLTPAPVTLREIEVRVTYLTPTGAPQTVSLICRLTNFRTL